MKNDKEKFKKEFRIRIHQFTLSLIKFVDNLSKDLSSHIFAKQILRSGTSIGANYIEAQASSSKKDFTNFFHHALKSANETQFWLTILRDAEKCNKEEVNKLLAELIEIANILGSSILTLKGRNKF